MPTVILEFIFINHAFAEFILNLLFDISTNLV